MLKPNSQMIEENRTSVFDPVDVVTGEFYLYRTDFLLPGPVPVEWRTYYTSLADKDSPLGRGWFHCFNVCLEFHENAVWFVNETRSVTVFPEITEIGGMEKSYNEDRLILRKGGPDDYRLLRHRNFSIEPCV